MARAASLKSIDSLSGVDAKMQALAKLEQLTDEFGAEILRRKSNVCPSGTSCNRVITL